MRVRAITVVIALSLALVPVGSVIAGTPAPGWTRARLVHSFTSHDRDAFDLVTFNGRAYAAVSGDLGDSAQLVFATTDTATGAFRKEVVATFPPSVEIRAASIAVAPNGDVYIGYEEEPDIGASTVALATNASGSWVSTPIPTTSGSGTIAFPELPDIAALSDGSIAMVFQALQHAPCTGNADVFFTTFANGAFSTPTNVTLNNIGPANRCVQNQFPTLAASGNQLHLAYRWVSDAGGGIQLHYRSGSLSNATDEAVDATALTTPGYEITEFGIDINADSSGTPHIAYTTANGDNSSFSTRYATKSDGGWVREEVQGVTGGRSVTGPSVAIAVSQVAVAYTVDGAGDDPGGSAQQQAFIAKRAGAGQPWAIDNLNRGNVDDVDPEIAAAAGRFHAIFLEINGLGANPFSYVYQHEAPRPTVEFNLTGGKTFRGGEAVPMRGDIDPATVPERVVINTQRRKGARWVNVDKKTLRSNADGEWSFRHPALPAGRTYRARAEVGDTVDHRAGKNPWVRFEVQARRNH